ncbi:MAG TPA: ATP-binding cassette domain-containing protein [Rickettsiales bacterium]|nr:ATP-binding cassette domain-containing protein [Rickettsiales bacterium]
MLKIDNLSIGYGNKPILMIPSLDLPERGECLVTGSSGGGKTTLLYAIAGLVPVLSGSIIIDRIDITRLKEAEMDRFRGVNLGVIFQTLQLMPSLTVMENLMLACYAVNMPPNMQYITHVLNKLGIYERRDYLPSQISRGQAQRVAIARAVMHMPRLLLADEPTASLDDANCETVLEIIRELAEETGAALMIATHDSRVKPHFRNVIHFEKAP